MGIFRKPWNGSCFQGQEKDTNNMVEYKDEDELASKTEDKDEIDEK